MNSRDLPEASDFDLLRSLLTDGDSRKIDSLSQIVEVLVQRAGDDEALRNALVPVLAKAIQDIEKNNPRPMARALSPFIVSSIKREIANSRDDMVEVLYPITGRLVSAAVKNAVASLGDDINRRVDEATSIRMLYAKLRSWQTGQPASHFLLASDLPPTVISALLIDRDSGVLIAQAQSEERGSVENANLVTGLLSALTNLTEEVFTGSDDQLRTLDLNGRQIAFRRSVTRLFVLEFIGELDTDIERLIDERFNEIIEISDEDDELQLNNSMAALVEPEAFQSVSIQKSSKKGVYAILLLALGAMGWSFYGAWQKSLLDDKASQIAAIFQTDPSMAAYPVSIQPQYKDDRLTIRALLPSSIDQQKLEASILNIATDSSVVFHLNEIKTNNVMAQQALEGIEQVKAQHTDLIQKYQKAISIEQVMPTGLITTGTESVLANRVSSEYITFSGGITFSDSERAEQFLTDIATLLKESKYQLRIVGYGDSAGTLASIKKAAEKRALMIKQALIERGVDERQLLLAQRGSQIAISLNDGANSENRRVEFEPVYREWRQ